MFLKIKLVIGFATFITCILIAFMHSIPAWREYYHPVISTVLRIGSTRFTTNVTLTKKKNISLPSCNSKGVNLVGPLYIDQSNVNLELLEKELSIKYGGYVKHGGWYNPLDCHYLRKVAVVIPYRNRAEQLKMFLKHMHPMLQRQQLYYRIIVVEQLSDDPFNRAGLFNVGFAEAIKITDFDCFVFTDVDLLPEDDRNYYGCPTSPRHMSVAVDKFKYRLPYEGIFGGVGAFNRSHFEHINGMSNLFFGWGGEDDDLKVRINAKGYQLTRPSMKIGRYTMLNKNHFQSSKAYPGRFELLKNPAQRMGKDGLNSLKYNLSEIVEKPLATFVKVIIKKSMYDT